jgi:hypothetical protein
MQPIVRHLIVCEDIQHGGSPERFTPVRIITGLQVIGPVPFPLYVAEICVLALCTECRGIGEVQLRIRDEESGAVVFASHPQSVKFANNPLQVVSFSFRTRRLKFLRPSVYLFQLCYNDALLAEVPLRIWG